MKWNNWHSLEVQISIYVRGVAEVGWKTEKMYKKSLNAILLQNLCMNNLSVIVEVPVPKPVHKSAFLSTSNKNNLLTSITLFCGPVTSVARPLLKLSMFCVCLQIKTRNWEYKNAFPTRTKNNKFIFTNMSPLRSLKYRAANQDRLVRNQIYRRFSIRYGVTM